MYGKIRHLRSIINLWLCLKYLKIIWKVHDMTVGSSLQWPGKNSIHWFCASTFNCSCAMLCHRVWHNRYDMLLPKRNDNLVWSCVVHRIRIQYMIFLDIICTLVLRTLFPNDSEHWVLQKCWYQFSSWSNWYSFAHVLSRNGYPQFEKPYDPENSPTGLSSWGSRHHVNF